jgi:predicted AAA+ superfamily ATPase
MIDRPDHLGALEALLRRFPVVAVLGPRQVGKTTLARQIFGRRGRGDWYDCEDPRDLARLGEPMLALSRARGLVVIDEIQRRPDLFPALRVLADRRPARARFLVLGSASGDLLRQAGESLAGRVAYHELSGLDVREVGAGKVDQLWLRGGFPRSFTARSLQDSARWRQEFIRTFLERDVPQLGVGVPAASLRRLWSMLAHVHGNVLNWSELGRSLGASDHVVRSYCDLLEQTFMVRLLKPWHANLAKRQVKAPKVYVRDSGILHALLDVHDRRQLEGHPKVGASFEGFCVEALALQLGARAEECFFWATHAGAELDLLVVRGARRRGFEIKYTERPEITPSMRIALEDLRLDRLDVIHAGSETFPLSDRVRAVSVHRVRQDVPPLSRGVRRA